MSHARETLLNQRVPRVLIEVGRAYVLNARNGGVGVAQRNDRGQIEYRIRREKFGRVFLDEETDWADCDTFGTAIPLRRLPDLPPEKPSALLPWLIQKEAEVKAEVRAAWELVLSSSRTKSTP